jgi:hypothetical protein
MTDAPKGHEVALHRRTPRSTPPLGLGLLFDGGGCSVPEQPMAVSHKRDHPSPAINALAANQLRRST